MNGIHNYNFKNKSINRFLGISPKKSNMRLSKTKAAAVDKYDFKTNLDCEWRCQPGNTGEDKL